MGATSLCSGVQQPNRGGSADLRILFIASGIETGGAERMLVRLVAGLTNCGADCCVFSLTGHGSLEKDLRDAGARIFQHDFRKVTSLVSGLNALRGLVWKFRPLAVQGWMYHGNLAALIASRMSKDRPPVVWGIRQCIYDLRREKASMRRIIRLSASLSGCPSAIVYTSRLPKEQHEAIGFQPCKSQIIGNAAEIGTSYSSDESAAVRRELCPEPDAIIVGHIARFDPVKDHLGFIRAATIAARADPRLHFVLVGPGVDNNNEVLTTALERGSVRGRYSLLGERSDIRVLLRAFDFLCLSSRSEGFPNILIEAQAEGRPCVTTNVGAAPEIIGSNGLLVPPEDPAALADAILRMARLSPNDRAELGAKAQEHTYESFSLDAVTDQYIALYSRLARMGQS